MHIYLLHIFIGHVGVKLAFKVFFRLRPFKMHKQCLEELQRKNVTVIKSLAWM